MLPRKIQEKTPIVLPEKWSNEVKDILEKNYAPQLKRESREFFVYGQTFPDEILLSFCLIDPKNDVLLPVTYNVSADLKEADKSEKLIDTLVDSVGIFFDHYFITDNFLDFVPRWTEATSKDQEFFYTVTRENIKLSIEANKLLAK